MNLFIWPKLLWPPLLTKALTVAKATLPKGILGRGGGPPWPKPPCPKAYLGGGGEAPRTCGSSCLGPWLEDLHRPPGPPSPPGSWGAAGRGGAGGGLTVVPIYAPPYPSPSFSRAGQVGTRLLHSLLLSRGRGRGKAFTVVPIYGPPPHPLPGNPACVLITQVLSSRTQAGHSAMPGSYGGGGGRAPLSSLQIRFAPLPPPPSLGGWRQQPARAV